jgi:hypothetical protein
MINIRYVGKTEYKINRLCYRAPEFETIDWPNSYIIQGCSAVFGVGTWEDDQIISYYLSEMLDAPVINLGVPGSGMGVQYVNTMEMLENNIKPKGVFIVYPSMDRYSLYTDGQIENIGPWSDNKKLKWMLNDNSRQHNLNLMRGYRLLWKLAGVSLYEWSHHGSNRDFCKEVITWDNYLDYGFDNQHWGPKTSKEVAKILFNQFQKRTSKTI